MKNILLILLLFTFSTVSFAQTVIWDGGAGTNNWNDALNWDTDEVPTSTDDVIIDSRNIQGKKNFTVEVNANSAANKLTIGGSRGNITLDVYDVLTVEGNIAIKRSSALYLTNNGTLYLGGNISGEGSFDPNPSRDNQNTTVIYNGSGSQTIYPTDYVNLIIDNTGTATLEDNISLIGNFTNNGSFSAGTYTVTFNGTSNISGTSKTTFYNIAAEGTIYVEGSVDLSNEMIFTSTANVDFDGSSNGGVFTVLSTSETNSARLGNMNGAAVTGDITVQRYIDESTVTIGGETKTEVWRYLTSPISGVTVKDWQEEIAITGPFQGTTPCTEPGQDCDPQSPSLFDYNESIPGNLSEGYWDPVGFPETDNNQTFTRGRGYVIWIRDFDLPVNPLDMRGTITSGSFNFPVSYTESPPEAGSQEEWSEAHDGWNLVGNPFVSSIDWDNRGWTFSNVYSTVYIKDNYGKDVEAGGFIVYNGTVGTSDFDGVIAMGQAFWVKANGNNPSMSATQDVKTSQDPQHLYRMAESKSQPGNVLRIFLDHNGSKDEAIVHFRKDATNGIDVTMDAPKFYNSTLNLSTVGEGQRDLVINSLPLMIKDKEVKLSVHPSNPKGGYSLTFKGFDTFYPGFVVWLHDNYTNKKAKMSAGSSYDFSINDDPESSGKDRFKIAFNNVVTGAQKKDIANDIRVYPNPIGNNAYIQLKQEGATLKITSVEGKVLAHEILTQGSNTISMDHLNKGIYLFRIIGESINYTQRVIKK